MSHRTIIIIFLFIILTWIDNQSRLIKYKPIIFQNAKIFLESHATWARFVKFDFKQKSSIWLCLYFFKIWFHFGCNERRCEFLPTFRNIFPFNFPCAVNILWQDMILGQNMLVLEIIGSLHRKTYNMSPNRNCLVFFILHLRCLSKDFLFEPDMLWVKENFDAKQRQASPLHIFLLSSKNYSIIEIVVKLTQDNISRFFDIFILFENIWLTLLIHRI